MESRIGRTTISLVVGPVLALVLTLAGEGVTSACSVARYPTVSEVRAGARAIFLGRAIARQLVNGAPDRWTFEVERVFKGDLPREVDSVRLATNSCSDDLGAEIGQSVVIALDVSFVGDRIDPVWVFRDSGRVEYATVDGGGQTLDSVVASLIDDLPPTDRVDSSPSDPLKSVMLALLFVLTLAGVSLARLSRRSDVAPRESR
jgi:hypothetical protein